MQGPGTDLRQQGGAIKDITITRLPYKLLLVFLAFLFILTIPFSMIVVKSLDRTVQKMESAAPLMPEQKAQIARYEDELLDNMIFLGFYIFVIAFILSIFLARKMLEPLRELHRGMVALKAGSLESRLSILSNDEFGDLTRAFNEMADVLRTEHVELERLRQYIGFMREPVWVVDEEGVVVDINPAFTRLFGYGRQEVVGSPLMDFLEDSSEKLFRRATLDMDTHGPEPQPVNIISKHEGLIPVEMRFSRLYDKGEPSGMVGLLRDNRSESALVEALKEEKAATETVMDGMVDQLLVIDRDYRITKANLAVRVWVGRDVTGETCHDLLHKSTDRCYMHGELCPVKAVYESGKPFRTVHEHFSTDGRRVFHDVYCFPVLDSYGEVRHVVKSMRDITERVTFEEEIDHKNRELTALNTISRVLSQSLKSEEIYSQVIDRVVSLFSMDGGGLFFADDMGRSLRLEHYKGLSEDFVKNTGDLRVGDDLPGKVALTGTSFLTADISKDKRAGTSVFRHTGFRGFACIPVRGKEKLLGVLFLFSFNEHEFTPEEEGILRYITEMMGISFENIRLYGRMRALFEEDRRRRIDEQKNLLSLSKMLASTLDMGMVLSSSLMLIRSSCWADFVWLLAADEKGALVLKAASAEGFKEGTTVYGPGLRSVESEAMAGREPLVLTGLAADRNFRTDERLAEYSTACSIPILIGDRMLGAFTLYYIGESALSEDEVHFLRIISSLLSVAMERTRLYENVIIQRGMADTILESIMDAVITMDTEGRILSMNHAAGAVFGVPAEKSAGLDIREVAGPSADNMEFRLRMEACIEESARGLQKSTEATYVTKTGKRLPLVLQSSPVYNNHGQIVGVVQVLRDLSAKTEMDMLKTEFVKSVSHEFRTPLTAIIGMTEMVLDSEVSPERARQYLGTVLSEATRLSSMVSDVLDVAKIESGRLQLHEDAIDFPLLVKDLEVSLADLVTDHAADMRTVLSGDLAGFLGDREKLKQVLRSLLENSLTYSERGVRVTLLIERSGDTLNIVVQDTGWGVLAEDMPRLGERFYRGHSAAKTKGTGLGLSLSKDIVRLHGGSLHITGKPGQGTVVSLKIPFRRKEQ